MSKPTCKEIFYDCEEEFEEVDRKVDDGWRHGSYVFEIYYREKDESFWGVSYRLSTDLETNEFREGIAEINRVEPIQVTKTEWKIVSEKGDA